MNEPKSKQVPPGTESSDTGAELQASTVNFDVVALSMTIYYNREGDHDHNGMVFALEANARPVRPSAPDGPRGGETSRAARAQSVRPAWAAARGEHGMGHGPNRKA
jgi:hypothetical protein